MSLHPLIILRFTLGRSEWCAGLSWWGAGLHGWCAIPVVAGAAVVMMPVMVGGETAVRCEVCGVRCVRWCVGFEAVNGAWQ